MSNVYSLVDLKAGLDKEFAPVELDLPRGSKVVLRNVMRLDSKDRAAVIEATKKFSDDADVDEMFEAVRVVLRTVADGNKGDSLVKEIGDDIALAMKIMNLWVEATQPGEAENSPA